MACKTQLFKDNDSLCCVCLKECKNNDSKITICQLIFCLKCLQSQALNSFSLNWTTHEKQEQKENEKIQSLQKCNPLQKNSEAEKAKKVIDLKVLTQNEGLYIHF